MYQAQHANGSRDQQTVREIHEKSADHGNRQKGSRCGPVLPRDLFHGSHRVRRSSACEWRDENRHSTSHLDRSRRAIAKSLPEDRLGRDFAFNATNTIRQTRQRWIDLFAEYGARVEVRYVEPPWPVILRQNATRPDPVPRRVIDRLADRLEPPTALEAHAVELVG